MFGITYKTWQQVCKMYFDVSVNSKKAYLQWFPFAKISFEEEQYIASKKFFEKYIEKASFVLFPKVMYQSDNFLQKGDGSFRNSSLLSPILYLVLQAIGKEISIHYQSIRNCNIDAFYAGNYKNMRAKYKRDYDNFYKLINDCIPENQYFIKTDVNNFFSSINVDILIDRVEKRSNISKTNFTPTQLKTIKELLLYSGGGRFPTIENSLVSSFLATIVYLDEIDEKIYSFINDKIECISSFKIIRYVDDMYIMINTNCNEVKLNEAYNQIRNEYSSILKKYGLSLNTKKCCLKPTSEINDELKRSLYDECLNNIQYNIEDLFKGKFQDFLNILLNKLTKGIIDINHYNSLINEFFNSSDVEISPNEVYNHFIYESESLFQDEEVISTICELINTDVSFISLDPKRIAIMIMKTKSKFAIKALLNQLFQRHRKGLWNSYDTLIAISYLIQSEFKHIDLLKILIDNENNLKDYYYHYCKSSFLPLLKHEKNNNYLKIINDDWKAYFLYFMHLVEKKRNNALAEYAFYKTFFDRITADLAFYYEELHNSKKPNYKAYYKKNTIKKFYEEIADSKEIIERAHDLRNENPLSHSSSHLIDKTSTSQSLKKSIVDLQFLIDSYINTKKLPNTTTHLEANPLNN